ncbi:MAG: TRAP transporter TatT component family protein, partial [Desulfobacteraceae bacterium]|nr:TRAP transporter TatT component family protein [Desulfobacteraceae bacterium]
RYGFEALSKQGDFRKAASSGREEFTKFLERYSARDVPNLFWTTTAWAGWIAASTGSVESMADLPALEATMERILALDETFYHGGPHLLQAVYLAAKPNIMGGDLARAKRHFDRAFALGSDRLLMAKVYFAQYYARGMKDRALYERTLRDVLAAPVDAVPELTLANTIAREKARKLLDRTEGYFEEPL